MITSASNQQLKNVARLQEKRKYRDEQNMFVCEGRRMFEEAKNYCAGLIRQCYVSESFYGEAVKADGDYFEGTAFEIVADRAFDSIAQTVTPQGILAVVEKPEYRLEDLLVKNAPRLLILEDIQDPGNLGTMVRTAEAAGIDGIIMSRGTVDIFNPKTIRSTMGSVFRVPFIYMCDMARDMGELKKRRVRIYAAELQASIDYREQDYSGGCAVMIGNEGSGLSAAALSLADCRIHIPMHGSVESLNAAIAAALLMFEMDRQGQAGPRKGR